MTVPNALPLRADARRNLERILQAAREAFAESGLDVGVEEIARRAGVGKATFFRRFPTKEALGHRALRGLRRSRSRARSSRRWPRTPTIRSAPLRAFLEHSMRTQAHNKAFFEAVAARRYVPAGRDDRPRSWPASSA